jgi:hypothetical protein
MRPSYEHGMGVDRGCAHEWVARARTVVRAGSQPICLSLLLSMQLLAGGCATDPPPPSWRAEARSWLDTAVDSYLRGDTRPAEAARARARTEIARSGRLDLAARSELAWCAARVASAEFEPCAGFEPLRLDAGADLRAYAAYLAGEASSDAARQLPDAHQAIVSGNLSGDAAVPALRAIADPLSRLVALGVLFQGGRTNLDAIAIGVDTASERGWRRPLLAWLNIQATALERAGRADDALPLRRRIELIAPAPSP